MEFSKAEINDIWKSDAGREQTRSDPTPGILHFMVADYVSQIEAILDPLVIANGPCEMAAALFRIGKRVGGTTLRGRNRVTNDEIFMNWGDRLEEELAHFAARSLRRVSEGGFLTVESMSVNALAGNEAAHRIVPWLVVGGAMPRVLCLSITIDLNRMLVAKMNGRNFRMASTVSVRSPWTHDKVAIDSCGFFGRGLVTGLLEQWLLASDSHRSSLAKAGVITVSSGEVKRDLSTTIASDSRIVTALEPTKRLLTGVYFAPEEESRS